MLKDYLDVKPVLQTQRLIIRAMTKSDVFSLLQWTPNKNLYKYWGKNAGAHDKNPALMFEKEEKPTKSFHLGIEEKSSGKVVGEIWVYLIENDRMGKVAFRIGEQYQKMGYATESLKRLIDFCFDNTELQRLWTDVHVENEPSIKVLEKCGFRREGLIRQGKMVSSWCDYYIYGLLKTDLK